MTRQEELSRWPDTYSYAIVLPDGETFSMRHEELVDLWAGVRDKRDGGEYLPHTKELMNTIMSGLAKTDY